MTRQDLCKPVQNVQKTDPKSTPDVTTQEEEIPSAPKSQESISSVILLFLSLRQEHPTQSQDTPRPFSLNPPTVPRPTIHNITRQTPLLPSPANADQRIPRHQQASVPPVVDPHLQDRHVPSHPPLHLAIGSQRRHPNAGFRHPPHGHITGCSPPAPGIRKGRLPPAGPFPAIYLCLLASHRRPRQRGTPYPPPQPLFGDGRHSYRL